MDFTNFTIPNIWGNNMFMSSFQYMPSMTNWFNPLCGAFTNFIPQINMFAPPIYSTYMTIPKASKPVVPETKPEQIPEEESSVGKNLDIDELYNITIPSLSYDDLETELTNIKGDNVLPVVSEKPKTNFKPKSTKTNLGNKNFPVVAEELLPGCFINKGKYLNIKDLKPYMKDILVKLDKKAKELGYSLVVIDGFRSHATQAAAKKRKPKLCAPAGKSAHEYGVAVDLALYDSNGKQVSIDKVLPFATYAQSLGLEWGGYIHLFLTETCPVYLSSRLGNVIEIVLHF